MIAQQETAKPGRLRRLGEPFWRYAGAYGGASLAEGIRTAALPLLAASLTRSPLLVASVTFCLSLPWLLVTLPSGVVIDRLDRRRVMQAAGVARVGLTALLIALLLLHLVSVPVLAVLALLLGAADTFGSNAAIVLVRQLVGPRGLESANAVVSGIDSVLMTLVGPALGALLFAAATLLPFSVDACAFLLSVALLQRLRGSFRAIPQSGEVAAAGLMRSMVEGMTVLWRHRLLRVMASLVAAENLAYGMAFSVLVLFVLEVLHLPRVAYGELLAATGVGGILGAAVGIRLGAGLRRLWIFLPAITVQGLVLTVAGLFPNVVVVGVCFLVFGVGDAIAAPVFISYRQRVVPDALLGRVTSAYRLLGIGAYPIGAILGGALGELLGLRAPLILGGLIMLGALLLALPALSDPDLQRS